MSHVAPRRVSETAMCWSLFFFSLSFLSFFPCDSSGLRCTTAQGCRAAGLHICIMHARARTVSFHATRRAATFFATRPSGTSVTWRAKPHRIASRMGIPDGGTIPWQARMIRCAWLGRRLRSGGLGARRLGIRGSPLFADPDPGETLKLLEVEQAGPRRRVPRQRSMSRSSFVPTRPTTMC